MDTYDSKLALITGGSSGIGLAIAKEILSHNGNVAILARRQDLLDKAFLELEKSKVSSTQQIHTLKADVTKFDSLQETLLGFSQNFGVPDLIFNSAGVAHPGNFSSLQPEIFHWMMDVNYFGTVNVLKILVPLLQQRRSGSIVNISSIAGFIGVYGYTAYGASKFAVSGFTDALRAELKPYKIQVSIVFPPDTDTPQLEYESKYKPFVTKEIAGSTKMLSPESVAKEVIKRVSQKRYLILPGFESKFMYFGHHFLSGRLYPLMDLMVRSAIKKIQLGK
jgi:3-dehydrosphinganine reductase